MIPQRNDGLTLLTDEHQNGSRNFKIESQHSNYCSPIPPNCSIDGSVTNNIPLEILVDHIAPFLDRRTYNSCLLLCRKARTILQASWWKQNQGQIPPWPRKLVSRDYFCRVRCLTFSEDNRLLACGCCDGKIRMWDVRLGELPMPRGESHWPDEAVVALAYSNRNDRRLLASSSTDGTIRIWKISSNSPQTERTNTKSSDEIIQSDTTSFGDEDNFDLYKGTTSSPSMVAPQCALCFPSDHAVSLHFSPDDSYLVSGHLVMRDAQDMLPSSTIEIREVRTGSLLRRLEDGGIPLGFVRSLPSNPDRLHESSWKKHNTTIETEENDVEEHRLLATCGPNTCLKLWSWNRTRCVTTSEEIENDDNNSNTLDYITSGHGPTHEIGEQSIALPIPFSSDSISNDSSNPAQHYETAVDAGRCIQQWFLDRFNTVSPIPTARREGVESETEGSSNSDCELLVAVINEPSKDSFSVWNTSAPKERKIFRNTNPYEIRFSPDGTKIASVDDFNTVKVWRISDGVLLKTFSGGSESTTNYYNASMGFSGEDLEDSDETSVSYEESDYEDALFPIHELVFSRDSSTVAVISRCYNEVHLFST